jgi:hypothetical protein
MGKVGHLRLSVGGLVERLAPVYKAVRRLRGAAGRHSADQALPGRSCSPISWSCLMGWGGRSASGRAGTRLPRHASALVPLDADGPFAINRRGEPTPGLPLDEWARSAVGPEAPGRRPGCADEVLELEAGQWHPAGLCRWPHSGDVQAALPEL